MLIKVQYCFQFKELSQQREIFKKTTEKHKTLVKIIRNEQNNKIITSLFYSTVDSHPRKADWATSSYYADILTRPLQHYRSSFYKYPFPPLFCFGSHYFRHQLSPTSSCTTTSSNVELAYESKTSSSP